MSLLAFSVPLPQQAAETAATGVAVPRVAAHDELIVADGLCPQIADLQVAALIPSLNLGLSANPLAAIGAALAQRRSNGRAVHTLHLLAHGRAGAFQIGGRWITAASLAANAELLAGWQVQRIALWSCEVGAEHSFIALLEELSGAQVWSSRRRLGRIGESSHWQLETGSSNSNRTSAVLAPWSADSLQAWPHQLASYRFATAFQVTNVAGKEQNLHTFDPTLSLPAVDINDQTGSNRFSGNDVSASAIVVGGVTYFVWISRPIKVQGQVVGFYCWTDADFTSLADAQADGNQDRDGNTGDNIGFVLVVAGKEDFFRSGTIGSSSDRVDTALNSLLPPPAPAPVAAADIANGTPGTAGGAAVEAGGVNNGTAGADAFGNVLTNDSPNVGLTTGKTLSAVGTTSASTSVASGSTSVSNSTLVVGSYGSLQIGADGSYTYEVNNGNSAVQALRTAAHTLSDVFTYTMVDSNGRTSTTTLTIAIQGKNDAPDANDDYNTAKESLLPDGNVAQYVDNLDPQGAKAIGNVLPNDTDVDAGDGQTVLTLNGSATATTVGTQSLTFTVLGNNVKAGYFLTIGGVAVTDDTTGDQIQVAAGYTPGGLVVPLTGSSAALTNGAIVKFSLKADGTGSSDTGTVTSVGTGAGNILDISAAAGTIAVGMTVVGTGLPTAPTITGVNYDASGNIVSISISANASLTGQAISFVAAAGTTLTGRYGTLILNSNGGYVYTPFAENPDLSEGDSAVEVFDYTMADTAGATSSAKLHITVLGSGANDPNANPDVADGDPGTPGGAALEAGGTLNGDAGFSATGNVLSDDETPTGTTPIAVSGVANLSSDTFQAPGTDVDGLFGSIQIEANGNYTYTVNDDNPDVQALNVGDTLTDTFRYAIINSSGLTDVSTVTVVILGANDAPVAANDSATAIEAGGSPSAAAAGFDPSGDVLANDSDVDNGAADLTVTAVRTGSTEGAGTLGGVGSDLTGTYGSLNLSADGTWNYVVDQSNPLVNALKPGQTLTDSFNYTLSDGDLTDIAVLSITIQGAADSVDIDSIFVNEASPKAVFTVRGQAGIAVKLSLGNAGPSNDRQADIGTDTGAASTLEYFDSVQGWTPYTPGSYITIEEGNILLVRVPINQDDEHESNESFTLTATTKDDNATVGIGTINDEGEGDIYLNNNNTGIPNEPGDLDPNGPDYPAYLDDDRPLSVRGTNVNEGSPYVQWSVTGAANQWILLESLTPGTTQPTATPGDDTGNAGASQGAALFSEVAAAALIAPAPGSLPLQILVNGQWIDYTLGSPIQLDASGRLLVRINVINDDIPEGTESLTLVARNLSGGAAAEGDSTINDAGQGSYFAADNTSNVPALPPGVVLDNDQPLFVSSFSVNEGSPTAVFTIIGSPDEPVALVLSNISTQFSAADLLNIQVSRDGGATWISYTPGSFVPLNGSGGLLARTPLTPEQEAELDDGETFKLTATKSSGISSFGIATIRDTGIGIIFGDDGTNDANAQRDDDRPLTINPITVNEGSPFAVFKVSGADGQAVLLSLRGAGGDGAPDPAGGAADLGTPAPVIQYFDGSSWRDYNPATPPRIVGSDLLVRVAIGHEQDEDVDGPETFTLVVTNTGGRENTNGIATIVDNGSGAYFAADNTTGDSSVPEGVQLDDDRLLVVNNINVNEASGFAVFTVSGGNNQLARLSLSGASGNGSPDAAGGAADLGTPAPVIQYLDGAIWRDYNPSAPPRLIGGTLMVRVAISNEQETELDGPETFTLVATNSSGTPSSGGLATILDNGQGDIFNPDGSVDPNAQRDDDRPLAINSVEVNEASPYAVLRISGAPNQRLSLSLPGTGSATPAEDYLTSLQVSTNNGATWVNYNPANAALNGSGLLLARIPIVNDSVFEGSESFPVVATNTGGGSVIGIVTIRDDAAGTIFNNDGTPNNAAPKDDDRRPTKMVMQTDSDSGKITDLVTANGKPQLQVVGSAGFSGRLSLRGVKGEILTPGEHYTIREVALTDQPGKAIYLIDLIDADLSKPGRQAYGKYYKGESTGNGHNTSDGIYTVLYDNEPFDTFRIKTKPLKQAKRIQCLNAIYSENGNPGLESKLFGYRTEKQSGSPGDDILNGSDNRSDRLDGKDGSDLLNGVGDRLTGSSLNPGLGASDQVDVLIGGKGRDAFQLGDVAGHFYGNGGRSDYALIEDFDSSDSLILQGEAADYRLISSGSQLELSRDGDLIAIIRGSGLSGLDLDSAAKAAFL
jgi:VCBS repeat-containing protein